MSQLILQGSSSQSSSSQSTSSLLRLWSYLEREMMKGAAFLLPLRLFIGLGWLRAGAEKLLDPAWTSGHKLPIFFQTQIASDAVYFPFYETLIIQFFEPNALILSWIIIIGELLAGGAILTGTLTNLALLSGLFMNLNFVLAGVVNPSAFYIMIQCGLLAANAGATLGGDSFLSRYSRSFFLVAQSHFERGHRTSERWLLLFSGILSCLTAWMVVPYIRDFGPHSIDDPAMLLFILFMLGGLLLGILFIRMSIAHGNGYKVSLRSTVDSSPSISKRNVSPATLQNDQSTVLPKINFPQINHRKAIYPSLLVVLYAVWGSYMMWSDSWYLFRELWPVSLTMTLGSFVAGATAEGGAAIAFPVFTKVLHIASTDARTFGLMIQAVGMTMAGIVILIQRVKVLPRVILWATLGGVIGQVIGTFWVHLPNPYPKILFTFTAAVFGLALIISRWGVQWEPRATLHRWTGTERGIFLAIGICGGTFAAITGSGIDMLTFIVLTLAFGINEKISTPTTVIIMAINSIVGFALHGLVLQDIGVAWSYWLVALPIVVIGAPLGATVASRAKRDQIIFCLLTLITLELVTTIILVPFSPTAMRVTALAVAACSFGFGGLLLYRQCMVPTATEGNTKADDLISEMADSTSHSHQAVATSGFVLASSAAPSNTARPSDPSLYRETDIRVCCANCHQTQDAKKSNCVWCGTSLAIAYPVQDTESVDRKRNDTGFGLSDQTTADYS
ncbi:MAG: sulfite exporter TauE/SafE family protein [Chloroflexota bacterium]